LKILVTMKSLAKRRNFLMEQEYILPDAPSTLRDLLTELVKIEATRYNAKETEAVMVPFLTDAHLLQQAEKGKVSFHVKYNELNADLQKAIETMVQSFSDGLFKVFHNGEEKLELDEPMQVQDGDRFTFIKLTMLAGRMW
jgi:hypothetical protein